MLKRPQSGETEDDILRLQEEFLKQKERNPKMQPAAQIIKIEKPAKQSLFAKSRQQRQQQRTEESKEKTQATSSNTNIILDEIHNKIVADFDPKLKANRINSITDIIIGDIVEKSVQEPKRNKVLEAQETFAFPKIEKLSFHNTSNRSKSNQSLFAQAMSSKAVKQKMNVDESNEGTSLDSICGPSSVIIQDAKTAKMVHEENLNILKQMTEEEILAEKQRLLESLDPALVALMAKKRKENIKKLNANEKDNVNANQIESMDCSSPASIDFTDLPESSPVVELVQRSAAENWLNFDVVEKDKLKWMHDISLEMLKLKPGEKFEARFDWKGVLLPYSMESVEQKDDRDLYLHGAEPHRPGYTLQELFRLARSNVMQQRIAAFSAIAGILNIYQQGFYDQVLELPIAKIFFLLRYGFDDNTPAMLEVVGKALSYLFYNETDEISLDFCYENPGCHWQPTLQVLKYDHNSEDPCSVENLQKQMLQLQLSQQNRNTFMNAPIEEAEEESKISMSDFQLAETDLIECLCRTNILQRIYFILNCVKPDNSTVTSCLKLLIRLARSGKDVVLKIVNNEDLIKCLLDNFLPGLEKVDTSAQPPPFYNNPQYLCLKLMRVLISTQLDVAVNLVCTNNLIDILQNYLFNREDIKSQLIKVQTESLRILKCLFMLRCENDLHKTFLPAFRYMLKWHYNHVIYEEGGPFLIRQHAAALLAAIASMPAYSGISDITTFLGDILSDCCCKWFQKAKRFGVTEFSQATLLSCCLNAVAWYTQHCDLMRFDSFLNTYLKEFIDSELPKLMQNIQTSSIILRDSIDRRSVYNALPNVGSIIINKQGPQLIVTQTYPVFLITAAWHLMELLLQHNNQQLFNSLLTPPVLEPLIKHLCLMGKHCNRYLSTNFFAKCELKMIYKLLTFPGIETYFKASELLQIVYNFICCLTAEYIPEIEQLFKKVIFNEKFLEVEEETLKMWQTTCLELVHAHYIVVSPAELTLSLPFSQTPVLPLDWPYFQLKLLLQNYVEDVQRKPCLKISERDILRMTLNFVGQLEIGTTGLEIVAPTEKLMYLMIAFMGPESQFLDKEMHDLLRQHLMKFYKKCQSADFDFEEVYEGKCKFENLYALFVEHFQAASYGDELFGSLVLVPLAQKYDNKWRRRVWSEYAACLRFLHCDESLLIGGLDSYLHPPEEDESLLKAYNQALHTNLVRVNTIPYKIAKYHVEQFKQRINANV